MQPTMIVSTLDAILADAMARKVHFITLTMDHRALCRLCGATWDVEQYVADSGVCPGYSTCGMDPVGTQPISIGPAEVTR